MRSAYAMARAALEGSPLLFGVAAELPGHTLHAEICKAVLHAHPCNPDPPHPDININHPVAGTSLHWAVAMELPDVCLALLKSRDFDAVNDQLATDGSTALHIACAKGLDDVCAGILKRPDFTAANAKDRDGFTALHGAAYNGHSKCVALLLESDKFTEVDAVGEFDVARPSSHWATKAAERFDMRTVLHMAAANGHVEVIEMLLGSRGSCHSHPGRSGRWFTAVNETNRLGATALHMAAKGSHTAACRVILRHQAFTALNAKDVRGYTALHWSSQQPGAEICRAILAREDFTAIDAKNLNGKTAMDLGAEEGHPEIARAILARLGTTALLRD